MANETLLLARMHGGSQPVCKTIIESLCLSQWASLWNDVMQRGRRHCLTICSCRKIATAWKSRAVSQLRTIQSLEQGTLLSRESRGLVGKRCFENLHGVCLSQQASNQWAWHDAHCNTTAAWLHAGLNNLTQSSRLQDQLPFSVISDPLVARQQAVGRAPSRTPW